MRSDPIYLFQELTWKASLGVLSVAGNVCRVIIADVGKYVNESLLRLAFVLACLGDFDSLCEAREERFGSIEEIVNQKDIKI
ncbi:MAG: hypothetical protein LGB58_02975 [Sulfurovum sp.]|nr:hypothetical protein [Sulfurovum sp.]